MCDPHMAYPVKRPPRSEILSSIYEWIKTYSTFLLIYTRDNGYFMIMFYDMRLGGCALHSQIGSCLGCVLLGKGCFEQMFEWRYVWIGGR